VYDIARSFLFALANVDRMRGQVYNVGSERMNYSKRQLCELIRKKVDYYLHYADVGEAADKRNYVVSYEKISAPGYATTIDIGQGIDELMVGLSVLETTHPYSNV